MSERRNRPTSRELLTRAGALAAIGGTVLNVSACSQDTAGAERTNSAITANEYPERQNQSEPSEPTSQPTASEPIGHNDPDSNVDFPLYHEDWTGSTNRPPGYVERTLDSFKRLNEAGWTIRGPHPDYFDTYYVEADGVEGQNVAMLLGAMETFAGAEKVDILILPLSDYDANGTYYPNGFLFLRLDTAEQIP